ncbi:MAG TPA: HAD family hydrolase [Baekduia sp.]|nr:HAD family hydrolase [Baekduia sp.]
MPLPKNIQWVTFDVYGTLIDWEAGIADAFVKEARRDGVQIDKQQVVDLFLKHSHEVQSGSYELYAEVLRQAAVKVAAEIEWDLESSRAGFLPDSLHRWGAFRETNPQLKKILAKYKTGLIANIDDKLLGQTRRHIPADFDLVVTAQQVRSYKPDEAHFKEFARRIGGKKGWVHICSGIETDVEPAMKMKVPVIWVNRRKDQAEGKAKPTEEVKTLLEATKLLGL